MTETIGFAAGIGVYKVKNEAQYYLALNHKDPSS